MTLLHAIGTGFFFLILTYLALKNADGVSTVFKSGGEQTVNITKALQGR